MSTLEERPGISAVLMWRDDLDVAVLDLAAVLSGLVGEDFEIIVIVEERGDTVAAELRARAPALPLRTAASFAVAYDVGRYNLIMTSASDGRFDVRELNHLMEAIEHGADLAAGYRPGRADAVWRRLRRLGLPTPRDYAFLLMRRELARGHGHSPEEVRRCGYEVIEVPVSHNRPSLGSTLTAESRAA